MFSKLFAVVILCFLMSVEGELKKKENIQLNCDEATEEKCENSLLWEKQCPDQCDPYPNACHACRDKMYFCDDLTAESKECDDWEVKGLCLKTCGVCHCNEPTHMEL